LIDTTEEETKEASEHEQQQYLLSFSCVVTQSLLKSSPKVAAFINEGSSGQP
jgi:hypothetical protein